MAVPIGSSSAQPAASSRLSSAERLTARALLRQPVSARQRAYVASNLDREIGTAIASMLRANQDSWFALRLCASEWPTGDPAVDPIEIRLAVYVEQLPVKPTEILTHGPVVLPPGSMLDRLRYRLHRLSRRLQHALRGERLTRS